MRLILDPGEGPAEDRCVGEEVALNVEIALRAAAMLALSLGPDSEIALTRRKEDRLEHDRRLELLLGADMAVRIEHRFREPSVYERSVGLGPGYSTTIGLQAPEETTRLAERIAAGIEQETGQRCPLRRDSGRMLLRKAPHLVVACVGRVPESKPVKMASVLAAAIAGHIVRLGATPARRATCARP